MLSTYISTHVEMKPSKQGMLGNIGSMLSYVQGGPSARGKAFVNITKKLKAKHNFNFGINIMWSASRGATLYLYGERCGIAKTLKVMD